MNSFFRCLALAPLPLLLAACCANNACSRDDLRADSLYLTLKRSAGLAADNSGFTPAELDTVYLRRYSPATPNVLSDPVAIVRGQRLNKALKTLLLGAQLDSNTIVISNTFPFPPSVTGGKLDAYNYLLTVKDGRRDARAYEFRITDIGLVGQYKADGCCTNYQNTGKRFRVNQGDLVNETETSDTPVSVLLSRP